jgi:hypothetical protein
MQTMHTCGGKSPDPFLFRCPITGLRSGAIACRHHEPAVIWLTFSRHTVLCCAHSSSESVTHVPGCAMPFAVPVSCHRLEERLRAGIMSQLEGVVLNGPADVEEHR